ncbi:MAG: hypothetical protein IJ684_00745 [Bacteroidales bacterium]|nr:hypothetical protein [Bacteroidales bacterium]
MADVPAMRSGPFFDMQRTDKAQGAPALQAGAPWALSVVAFLSSLVGDDAMRPSIN